VTSPPPAAGRAGFGARLASDSVVYGLGGMANQAVAIILVPIYARQLGAEGVGVAGVLNSTISLALMFVGLALPQAFFRWYLREAVTDHDRARVLGTTLGVRLAASLAGFALVLVASIPITGALYGGEHLLVFALAAPIVMFDSFNAIPLSFLRAERKPRDYVAISVSRAVLGTILILSFVVVTRLGVAGVALGGAIAAAASAVIGTWALARAGALRLMLDWSLARSMIGFALPLVPAAMAGWVLNLSDRPLLQAMTGDRGLVGVYTMGYTGGLIINALAIQPFTLAWGAAFWEVSRRDDAARVFARALTWFLAIAAGAALLLSGLGTDALRLLVGAQFEESRFIVPFSAFAYVLYGAYTVGASGLSVVGRSGIIAITMGIAALATLVLNILLIPVIGMFGAALSTLLGYLLLAIVAGAISQRHFPVAWELGRGATILLIAASLSAAALLGPDHVLWRIGCVIAYGPLLLGLGIVKLAQGRALLSVLRR
jgi:O-antigen/teichoic acid export membrane protein